MPAVTVALASSEQQGLIGGLLKAYLAELGVEEAYPYLPLYWQEPNRLPYVIGVGNELVGFALVRDVEVAPLFEMAEFYVVPSYRRLGIGRAAVSELLALHRGSWRIDAVPRNVQAEAFWASVIPVTGHAARRRPGPSTTASSS
jgi:predicted acetyltransferase